MLEAKKLDVKNSMDYAKAISVFFLGLGVAAEYSAFLVIASLIALWVCVKDENRFSNLKKSSFNKTILYFMVYLVVVALLCVFKENYHGLRELLKFFEKLSTFFIVYLLLGDIKDCIKYGLLGFAIGIICGEAVIGYEKIKQIHKYGGARFGGRWGNPNSAGAVLELAFPALIYLIYRFRESKLCVFIGGATLIGLIPTVMATGSRGAMMAIITESVFLLGLYVYRKFDFKSPVVYTAVIILVGLLAIYTIAHLYPRRYDIERYLAFVSTWNMIQDNPLFGVGFGQWGDIYRAHYISPLARERNLVHSHNTYLFILAETGLVGFIAFFNIIVYQIKKSILFSISKFKSNGNGLNIADMFLAIIFGSLIHNMVDVYFVIKFYLWIYLFLWCLFCTEYEEDCKE